MSFKIFISYSTRDRTRTFQVKRLLERVGAKVFVAEYSLPAGAELTREIIAAIKVCDLFVLLWSHHARNSEWVPQEIGVAKGCDKLVIPIVLHAGAEVPGFLRGIKYLPFYSDPIKALRWLERHIATKVAEKSCADGFTLLGVTSVLFLFFSQDKRRR